MSTATSAAVRPLVTGRHQANGFAVTCRLADDDDTNEMPHLAGSASSGVPFASLRVRWRRRLSFAAHAARLLRRPGGHSRGSRVVASTRTQITHPAKASILARQAGAGVSLRRGCCEQRGVPRRVSATSSSGRRARGARSPSVGQPARENSAITRMPAPCLSTKATLAPLSTGRPGFPAALAASAAPMVLPTRRPHPSGVRPCGSPRGRPTLAGVACPWRWLRAEAGQPLAARRRLASHSSRADPGNQAGDPGRLPAMRAASGDLRGWTAIGRSSRA